MMTRNPVRCLEIVSKIFADHIDTHPQPANRYKNIKAEISRIRNHFGVVYRAGPVDYGDVHARLAYVYMYMTSTAVALCHALSSKPSIAAAIPQDPTLTSIGCGPGSDVLGLLKFLAGKGRQDTVDVFLLDHCAGWEKAAKSVLGYVDGPVNVGKKRFHQLDVCSLQDWHALPPPCLSADILSMVKVHSEFHTNESAADPCFHYVIRNMKTDALLVLLDNCSTDSCEWFDTIRGHSDLATISADSERIGYPCEESYTAVDPLIERFEEDGQTEKPLMYQDITFAVMRKV